MGEEGGESILANELWKKPLGTPSSRSPQAETGEPEWSHGAGAGVTNPLLVRPGVS